MSNNIQFVDFETYCNICKHKNRKEIENPCNECLDSYVREGSSKPERWEAEEYPYDLKQNYLERL